MHERPSDVTDSELAAILRAQWGISPAELRYLPEGFGGYHWIAAGPAGPRWFVTVSELGGPYGADLAAAMETAAELGAAGLDFIVAPVRTSAGQPTARLGPRYAVTVFPYVRGAPGRWDDGVTAADRRELVAMLAALHSASPPATVPVRALRLARREVLTTAIRELGVPWRGGPFAEPARRLLAGHERDLSAALSWFDVLVRRIEGDGRPLAVTHGEPHPGNLLRAGSRFLLIDWDSVGMAPPERDLWDVLADGGSDARRYEALTGRAVSPDAVALYRLRWPLDDICLFTADFRAPHVRDDDTQTAFTGLADSLASLRDLPPGEQGERQTG